MVIQGLQAFRIMTFGGAGGRITNRLLEQGCTQDSLFHFDCDLRSLKHTHAANFYHVGQFVTYGAGTNGDPKLAKQIFDGNVDKILFDNITEDDRIYILIGCLGGGFFSGILGCIAEMLKRKSRTFVIISSFPYTTGEKSEIKNALDQIANIDVYTDNVILFQNDDLRIAFGDMSKDDTNGKINENLIAAVKEILVHSKSLHLVNKESMVLNAKLEERMLAAKEYIRSAHRSLTDLTGQVNRELNKRLLIECLQNKDSIRQISPRKFEELVELVYSLKGYPTELTPVARDHGADVLVWLPVPFAPHALTIVQAKRYADKKKVSSEEVRTIKGSKDYRDADFAQVVTTSDFTKDAIDTAKKLKINLLKFYELDGLEKLLTTPGKKAIPAVGLL